MSIETPAWVWTRNTHEVFEQAGIEQIAYVPDARRALLVRDCEADDAMNVVSLATEEVGVTMQEPVPRDTAWPEAFD